MNELNKLYEAMWKSWDGHIASNSVMSVNVGNELFPVIIDEQELYLPKSEVLDSKTVGKVFFHPACENITSKETEVFKIVRRVSTMKLLFTFMKVIAIVAPISNRKVKKAWRQDVVNMLTPYKGVKRAVINEVVDFFSGLEVEAPDNGGYDMRLVHIKTTKSNGRNKDTGEKIYYKAKPVFPVYNEAAKLLARSEGIANNQLVELLGKQISVEALKAMVHTFEICLPGVNSPDDYECEANSPVAARLTAYLNTYVALAEDINRIRNIFREDFDKAGIQPIYVDWSEQLETLPDIYRLVPQLDYNSHNTQVETTSGLANKANQLYNITSNQPTQPADQQVQHVQQQQIQPMSSNIVTTPNGDFDVSAPQMLDGDTYLSYEIDPMTGRVKHHAQCANGQRAIYWCTKNGNFLSRELAFGGMGGNNGGGMDAAALMAMGIPPEKILQMQMMGQSGMNPQQIMMMRAMQGQMGGMAAPGGPTTVQPGDSGNGAGMFAY